MKRSLEERLTRKLIWNISTITDIFLNRHLYRVFTYIYSLLIEKDIRDRQNISNKFPGVCVHLSSGDLFIFR